ncbi:MAG: ABC transporter permease, partial [Anaerolineae bacterium]|nr:ABC transporter permease [Anaerolineae bacterium]
MNGLNRIWKFFKSSNLTWSLLALALVLLVNFFVRPGFFALEIKDGHLYGSLVDIINRGAPLMVLAIGMTLVIATGGTDLSVGPVIAITAAVATSLIGTETGITHTPLVFVFLISLAVAGAFGLWNGFLVSRIGIQPIVATLILMVAGRGVAQMITDGQIVRIFYEPYFFFGGGYLFVPFPLFVVAGAYLIAWLLTRRTAFGLFIESIGINARSSFRGGINEKNIKLMVYMVSGLCAGIAG